LRHRLRNLRRVGSTRKKVEVVMQNILVALDGSPVAEVALPFATAIATRAGARLTLVSAALYRTLFGDIAAQQVRVLTHGEDYLARIATALREDGVSIDTRVPVGGSPAEWIVEESEYLGVDLVVMATHDRERLDRWLHGSVAEDVVHRTATPVMLVKATVDSRLAQRFLGSQPNLIVPLDGSDLADAALPVAQKLARAIGGRIVLVAVVPAAGQLVAGQGGAIVTYAGPEHAALEDEAHNYLQARAADIGDVAGVEMVVRYGSAAAQISAAAEECSAAAVVMATHGRSGPVRSMLGSVAGGVLRDATMPVVMIHPTGVRPSETQASIEAIAAPMN
jgi:nucleotide-binding universal stress UspA family protein